MAPSARNPVTWDDYEGRASPTTSTTSLSATARDDEQALIDDGDDVSPSRHASHTSLARERRRSSVTNRLAAVADLGGVNSLASFARSWQRAAGFQEVIPRRPSFVYADPDGPATHDDPNTIQYGRSLVEPTTPGPETSLLRRHLEASPPQQQSSSSAAEQHLRASVSSASGHRRSSASEGGFRERESKALDAEMASGALLGNGSPSTRSSIFNIPPHLSEAPVIGSYGSWRSSHYGTIGGGSLRARSRTSVPEIWTGGDEDEGEEDAAHGEHEPILVREVKQGDKVVLTVEGQSTLPQSVFNSINAIIGVGLLSLPLAFRLSGWIVGLTLLSLTAGVTAYTSKLLAKCMDYDVSLITYSDLAYVSFGTRARIIVSALFTLELVAACVALVILFADSLALLLPGLASVNAWKCVCAVLVLMLNALPLRWLSYTSVIGIFSTFCIVCIVIIDGLVKPSAPGSLWEPAKTYLFPSNWLAVPLAYGLLASPWGAHSVFPSIYRDMRHPQKWGKAVNVTFSFSYILDTCLAVIGILMFGDGIRDAITSNILKSGGYPRALTILMCICVAIIPLTKIPLNARPLITTADVLAGVYPSPHQHHHHNHTNGPASRRAELLTSLIRASVRVVVVAVLLVISIAFPAFDSVCAFLGAALCTLISVVLPISFYLKLFWKDVSSRETTILLSLLVLFAILGTVGTIWTFLPKNLIGL